mgnify:CR=1 FL=1
MGKISAIIPAYNAEKYIKDAIESVLAQTYPAYEIIVVDDGSTDRTRETVKELQVSSCRYQVEIKYIYQENKGPGAARNAGIKVAKGEYIAFLDSDDMWMPEKIEKQARLLHNSDYAMVYCDMGHEVDGKLIYKAYLKEKGYKGVGSGDIYEKLLKENFIFTPTVLARKEALVKIGYFDESYRICEDYKMWLNIAKKYHIGFLDEVLVTRRRTKMNITEDKLLFIDSGIRLFRELLNSNNHSSELKNIIQSEYHRRFYHLGYYYWDKGDMAMARKNFSKSKVLKAMPYILMGYLPKNFINYIRRLKQCLKSA